MSKFLTHLTAGLISKSEREAWGKDLSETEKYEFSR